MSEHLHIEKPFLDRLAALGWTVIDQGAGVISSAPAQSLRTSFREWLLPEVFRSAVRTINITAESLSCAGASTRSPARWCGMPGGRIPKSMKTSGNCSNTFGRSAGNWPLKAKPSALGSPDGQEGDALAGARFALNSAKRGQAPKERQFGTLMPKPERQRCSPGEKKPEMGSRALPPKSSRGF
ncbi:MAG: hypothetical protein AB1648_09085, partial [Pseudomonadota bacterium]